MRPLHQKGGYIFSIFVNSMKNRTRKQAVQEINAAFEEKTNDIRIVLLLLRPKKIYPLSRKKLQQIVYLLLMKEYYHSGSNVL